MLHTQPSLFESESGLDTKNGQVSRHLKKFLRFSRQAAKHLAELAHHEEFVAALALVKDLHAEVKNAKGERFILRSTTDVRRPISVALTVLANGRLGSNMHGLH